MLIRSRRTGRLAEAERWLEDLFSPQVFPSLVAYVEIKRKEAIAHEFRATHGKGVDKNKKREKIYEVSLASELDLGGVAADGVC